MRVTPASAAAAISRRAPAAVGASGFSTRTCLPAWIASSATATWVLGGVATTTASTPGSTGPQRGGAGGGLVTSREAEQAGFRAVHEHHFLHLIDCLEDAHML